MTREPLYGERKIAACLCRFAELVNCTRFVSGTKGRALGLGEKCDFPAGDLADSSTILLCDILY